MRAATLGNQSRDVCRRRRKSHKVARSQSLAIAPMLQLPGAAACCAAKRSSPNVHAARIAPVNKFSEHSAAFNNDVGDFRLHDETVSRVGGDEARPTPLAMQAIPPLHSDAWGVALAGAHRAIR
jgi:hypothetical protein